MKEKKTSGFGNLGDTLTYVCNLIYIFCPLLILKLDLMISAFLLIIVMIVPVWGEVLRFILYLWAFSVAIAQPLDIFSIIFYVCAMIYFIDSVIPLFYALLKRK